jgi:hypothetical protein
MEITKEVETLVTQVVSIAWLRSCLEVGIRFRNKDTGVDEENELRIYESFVRQLDLFDMPDVKVNPKILEKNIYEVLGNYLCAHATSMCEKLWYLRLSPKRC